MATRVLLLVEVAEEFEDPTHRMGITEEAHIQLMELVGLGEVIDGPERTHADSISEARN